jgi:hypothetical protein
MSVDGRGIMGGRNRRNEGRGNMALQVAYKGFSGKGPHPEERQVLRAAHAVGLHLQQFERHEVPGDDFRASYRATLAKHSDQDGNRREVVAIVELAGTLEDVLAWLKDGGRGEVF